MPNKIELAIKGATITDVMKVVDPAKVEAFIAFALTTEVAMMWNGDSRLNLQGHQIPIIARTIMETYPAESLADLTLCFRRGVMGKYKEEGDKLLRIDGEVIMSWIQKYLEEKYQVIEEELKQEKDRYHQQIKPENSDRDWHKEWLDSLPATGGIRSVPDLTDDEQRKEGQEKPKKQSYPSTSASEIFDKIMHIEYIKANYDGRTGKPLPTWMSEEEWIKLNY